MPYQSMFAARSAAWVRIMRRMTRSLGSRAVSLPAPALYPGHSAMDRVAALRAMLEADPTNDFVRYGLAQEFVKNGNDGEALKEFRRILEVNPDYQAAYYHAGKVLERLGRIEEARSIYSQGIQTSLRTGDLHARSELEAALAEC